MTRKVQDITPRQATQKKWRKKGAIRYIHHATCIAIVLSYLFGAGLITLAVLWIWLSFQPIFWPFSTVEASENAKKFITEIENFFSMVVPPIIAFIVGYISKPNKKCNERDG